MISRLVNMRSYFRNYLAYHWMTVLTLPFEVLHTTSLFRLNLSIESCTSTVMMVLAFLSSRYGRPEFLPPPGSLFSLGRLVENVS